MRSSVATGDGGNRRPDGYRSKPPQGAQNRYISKLLKKSHINLMRTKCAAKDGVMRSSVDVSTNIPDKDINGFGRRSVFDGCHAQGMASGGDKHAAVFKPLWNEPIHSRKAKGGAVISLRSVGLEP